MGSVETPNRLNAAATIVPVPALPFTTPIVSSKGVQSFTRLSEGQYEIVLEKAITFEEGFPRVSVPANTRLIPGAQMTVPGTIRVSIFDADTWLPADPDAFFLTVFALVEGEGVGPDLPLAAVPPPPVNPRPLTSARVVYVSPTGNDSNDGLSAATPWLTVARMRTDLESYSLLDATYTWHTVGSGTLANVDITIPPITLRGSFDYVCDTYTVLAGPFTVTGVSAGPPPTLTVASGLGVNTRRAKAIRILTGAAAGNIRSISKTTDTVATYTVAATPVIAIGDTFDIVEPAVTLTHAATVTWEQSGFGSAFAPATSGLGCAYLINLKRSGQTLRLFGGTWLANGIDTDSAGSGRLGIGGGASLNVGLAPNTVQTRLGQAALDVWTGWGLGQAVVVGTSPVLQQLDQAQRFDGYVVAPAFTWAAVAAGQFATQSVAMAQAYLRGGNLFGVGGAQPTLTVSKYLGVFLGSLFVGGNPASELIRVLGTFETFTGGVLIPEPGAAVTAVFKTYGQASIALATPPTAAALAAAGSYGCDVRLGGSIRWAGAPNMTGVAGDTIVDAAPIANAAYTAAGVGFANAAMGGRISRQS